MPGTEFAYMFWLVVATVLVCKFAIWWAEGVDDEDDYSGEEGWLYFIGNGRGPIKVGITRDDPEDRLAALQTGNPTTLRLLYAMVVDNPEEAEGRAHNLLADAHVGGEWYQRGQVLALIAYLKGETPTLLNVIEGGQGS